jgi:tetratricopeptide (TPR) repeat protein
VRRAIVLVGGIAALLLACGALAFFLLPKGRPAAPTTEDFASIDRAIAGGYLSTAEEALRSLRVMPENEHDSLALLKRAFDVCSATGDYGVLADLGARALARQGRSAGVRSVAAYGALRAGRVAEARKILARGASDPGAGNGLRAELALRTGGSAPGSDSLAGDLMALDKSRDPSRYEKAALRTGDVRLYLDAALLQMQTGGRSRAQLIARSELQDAAYDEPAANISYDAGDFQTAVNRLGRLEATRPGRAEVGFLRADAYRALGSSANAERCLVSSLPFGPRLSWTPYADLAFLAMQRDDVALASRRIEQGLAFFPGSVDLGLARAELLQKAGDRAGALSVLSKLAEDHPEDGDVALSLLGIQAPAMSPEQYRARLWKIFNRAPADGNVFKALCIASIAARDWQGAAEALRQHGDAGGGAADKDLLLLQGMVSEMAGDAAGAMESFSHSEALAKDGVGRYDLALVLLRHGGAKRAAAELADAADEYARRAPAQGMDGVLARMALAKGAALLLDGDAEGARSSLARSLMLDPQSLRASLLLKKLDAEVQ